VQTAASLDKVDATLDQVVTGWTPTRRLRARTLRRKHQPARISIITASEPRAAGE
jgi:hypothetical protein